MCLLINYIIAKINIGLFDWGPGLFSYLSHSIITYLPLNLPHFGPYITIQPVSYKFTLTISFSSSSVLNEIFTTKQTFWRIVIVILVSPKKHSSTDFHTSTLAVLKLILLNDPLTCKCFTGASSVWVSTVLSKGSSSISSPV